MGRTPNDKRFEVRCFISYLVIWLVDSPVRY